MAKVGRASRNASLMRVESITGAKAIGANETGELYFINYNTGATIVVNLPPVKEGAYCKFVWATEMVNNSAVIEFKPASGAAAGVLKGIIQCMEVDGTGPAAEKDGGSATKLSVDGNPDVNVGSYIEAICDGTSWHLSGIIYVDAGATATDALAWDA